jgi:RES domain-containing protein
VTREFSLEETHRLIPSKYSAEGTVLADLAGDDEELLRDLVSLDAATNPRLLADEGLLAGIGVHELVYGVRYFHIVNAAFTHASPLGGRFNTAERGAWYAGLEPETSMHEVAYHKLRQLEEVAWPDEEVSTCDDYLADFEADFEDLTGGEAKGKRVLKPEPVPACYAPGQKLATELLLAGGDGIVYPSVRWPSGTCVVCFRPALVYHVHRRGRLEFSLQAGRAFSPAQVRTVAIPEE